MKTKILLFCLIFFSAFSYDTSFAAWTGPTGLQALKATDVSIQLDWQDVPNAVGYYIYYGTKTASGGSYETEWIDLIPESEFLLDTLIPETPYFIAVTSVDELGIESSYSTELKYSTLKVGQSSLPNVLRISSVEVVNSDTLEFLFSQNLDTSPTAVREFMIENTKTWKEVAVDISDIDSTNPKNIIVVLSEDLEVNTSYKVTVLDIRDTSGKSIESGVDAFINFKTPATFQKDPVVNNEEDVSVDLNAAPEEDTTKGDITTPLISAEKPVANNAGETISSGNIPQNTTLQTAEDTTKLPQTWPTQWALLIIALIFWAMYYFFTSRKIISHK